MNHRVGVAIRGFVWYNTDKTKGFLMVKCSVKGGERMTKIKKNQTVKNQAKNSQQKK